METVTKGVLKGECLEAALRALQEGRLFFRISDMDGKSCNGGDGQVLPASDTEPGPWTQEVTDPIICERGWHATTDPLRWYGRRVALVEVDQVCARSGDKVVCHRMRELGVVDPEAVVDIRVWVAVHRPRLARADLSGVDLSGADLSGADLRDARFYRSTLRGARLDKADMAGTDLRRADLRGSWITGANMRGTLLAGAKLSSAWLDGVDLSGADLSGADLRGADLRGFWDNGADMTGATASGRTKWPDGFDPKARGVVVRKAKVKD